MVGYGGGKSSWTEVQYVDISVGLANIRQDLVHHQSLSCELQTSTHDVANRKTASRRSLQIQSVSVQSVNPGKPTNRCMRRAYSWRIPLYPLHSPALRRKRQSSELPAQSSLLYRSFVLLTEFNSPSTPS